MKQNEKLQMYKEYLQKRYPKNTHHFNKYLTDEYVVISRSDFNHVIRMINQLSNTLKLHEQSLFNLSIGLYELSLYVEQL